MSSRTCARIPGRCTLTTTSRPSRSVARCTWPSDAAASGVALEGREDAWRAAPAARRATISSTSSKENGPTSSWSRESASMYGGLNRSTREDISCPSLMKVGPIASRSSASRAAASGSPSTHSSSSTASMPRGAHEVAPPVAQQQHGDLAVALDVRRVDSQAHGPRRLTGRVVPFRPSRQMVSLLLAGSGHVREWHVAIRCPGNSRTPMLQGPCVSFPY